MTKTFRSLYSKKIVVKKSSEPPLPPKASYGAVSLSFNTIYMTLLGNGSKIYVNNLIYTVIKQQLLTIRALLAPHLLLFLLKGPKEPFRALRRLLFLLKGPNFECRPSARASRKSPIGRLSSSFIK